MYAPEESCPGAGQAAAPEDPQVGRPALPQQPTRARPRAVCLFACLKRGGAAAAAAHVRPGAQPRLAPFLSLFGGGQGAEALALPVPSGPAIPSRAAAAGRAFLAAPSGAWLCAPEREIDRGAAGGGDPRNRRRRRRLTSLLARSLAPAAPSAIPPVVQPRPRADPAAQPGGSARQTQAK